MLFQVPKCFPYFCVDFGMVGGFAHVIEDEKSFPRYFGRVSLIKLQILKVTNAYIIYLIFLLENAL